MMQDGKEGGRGRNIQDGKERGGGRIKQTERKGEEKERCMKIRRGKEEIIIMKGRKRRNKDEEEGRGRGRIMHDGKERKGEE